MNHPRRLPPFEKRDREKAMRRARKFIRKINPSAYEPDVDLEQIETVVPRGISLHGLADNLATLHGRWWHTFFQEMKWRDGLAGADRSSKRSMRRLRITNVPRRNGNAFAKVCLRGKLRAASPPPTRKHTPNFRLVGASIKTPPSKA